MFSVALDPLPKKVAAGASKLAIGNCPSSNPKKAVGRNTVKRRILFIWKSLVDGTTDVSRTKDRFFSGGCLRASNSSPIIARSPRKGPSFSDYHCTRTADPLSFHGMYRRFPIRCSIRGLLVTTTFFCVLLAIVCESAYRQAKTAKEIYAVGAHVQFSDRSYLDPSLVQLRRWNLSVEAVTLNPNNFNPADAQISIVAKLPVLKHLNVNLGSTIKPDGLYEGTGEGSITDVGLGLIGKELRHLKSLDVAVDYCSESAIDRLRSQLLGTKITVHNSAFRWR